MRIAVIPARSGSKRIPYKNIKEFCGKPIISYSINVAIESKLFDHVIVSTDCEEIAAVAKKYNAEIPFLRPEELSDDHTGTNSVVKHAIEWYQKQGHKVEYVCCIYATAPFLQPHYLRKGFEMLLSSGKAFTFSVTSFPFPIQRALRITTEGFVEAIFPENIEERSQDCEEAYHDAGQFCWGRAESFTSDIVTFSHASLPIIIPRHLVQDIDVPEDWHRAELMFRAWKMMEEEKQ